MIQDRLDKLRDRMKEAGISVTIIPTSDFHNSEYVSDYFQVRAYFSGFTGSAGTLVVTQDKAALFTDGRYFIQAEQELAGSGIWLMKMGEPDVPRIREYVKEILPAQGTIGFDGRVLMAADGLFYEKAAAEKGGSIIWHLDPADAIWEDRPALPAAKTFLLEEKYCGESATSKIKRLREAMREKQADVHILTTLYDIAWLLNLRGFDVECCPVFLAYAVITMEQFTLFAREESFGEEVRAYLEEIGVCLRPYDTFYSAISGISEGMEKCPDAVRMECQPHDLLNCDGEKHAVQKEKILLSRKDCNYRVIRELGEQAAILDEPNPTTLMKAIKNETECENLRKAHLMDGVAVTKFMYWLKQNVGKLPMTELSVADYLEKLRRENPSFLEPSFPTICAYGDNGAIIHYEATQESHAVIKPEGLLMVDSGGHYYEGSTDVTRTFVLGEISQQMRQDFTLVVRAMLRLKNTRFLKGCRGTNLDLAAREVLWEQGLDYKHGTGHGVGYLLGVHEGPNSFRYKENSDTKEKWEFEEGMVTTDEPGIYREGSHGIRIENELLCRKGEQNAYGQFMYFEDLTYVPIDPDGIDFSAMEKREIAMLNAYHASVYEKLSPFFEGEELAWLRSVTRAL